MNPLKKTKLMEKKPISQKEEEISSKRQAAKKVLYVEIDEEVTNIYDRIKKLKYKKIYIVVPKRALLFQSIVNLKILRRKMEELQKDIFIITNDKNGIHLATKIGLTVYDKLEGHEHPSLVEGKFIEDQADITPLKASINALDDDTPTRRTEKKYSISELLKRGRQSIFASFPANFSKKEKKPKEAAKKNDKGRLVLIAPNKHALILLVIITAIILLSITYIALPGATIYLTPKSDILDVTANITLADIEANKAELDTHPYHMIPSYEVTKKIQKVFTYQATGNEFKGENAHGKITIVNDADHEWPLVANTRFQTEEGLVFRIKNFVTVPAAREVEEDGSKKTVPGTIEVEVFADEVDAYGKIIGERGNIGPSIFFLPGLSGDSQKKIHGESKEAFASGKTNVTKLITVQDLEAARAKMASDLNAAAQAELQAFVKEKNDKQKTNLILLTGHDAIRTSEPSIYIPPNLEGAKQESFEVTGEIVATGVAYSSDELLSILKTELKLKKNPEKNLVYIDEDSLTYRIIETDPAAKKVKITATIKGIEEFELRPDKENGERLIRKIKDHVVGKNIDESETYIQNLPEIDKVYIESWPAWAPTMPGIPDNIRIQIKRD
jgi:hypothetical protein